MVPLISSAVLALLAVIGASVYVSLRNSLIAQKNAVDIAFGGVDAYLKKRHALIPNLVELVKGYMEHERGTLDELTQLRAKAVSGGLSPDEKTDVENKITKTMGGIVVAAENYPQLKAIDAYVQLENALEDVEEDLAAARRAYNAAVTRYNNAVEMFPTSLLAPSMGLGARAVFTASDSDREDVDVGKLLKS